MLHYLFEIFVLLSCLVFINYKLHKSASKRKIETRIVIVISGLLIFILIPGLLEDVAKSRSSSFDQSKPYEPSNGNGNSDFGTATNNCSGHKDSEQQQSTSKHLQPHSPDLIPERGKLSGLSLGLVN